MPESERQPPNDSSAFEILPHNLVAEEIIERRTMLTAVCVSFAFGGIRDVDDFIQYSS